ncbi:hypothetical protein Q4508_08785 [Amphritea sp. 2_MG-2023]|jgi:hypothetical protein|uniref:DUF6868 family protein n=1 Tax=Amphritea TaxID=515417 RepID=UPI001C068DC9|nr:MULTISPECIES: hypothetical protein [Amphritea]MBU2965496.1 hypothetical protein [Amphritea atlantica]MDO6418652.1 hypothetical protein [Amphritea sp. 2_MG-2023]MDX2421577.1 hypothetical protein [Amphritea sp.]
MMTLSQLTELLGWASLLNIGMLVFVSAVLVYMRPLITSIHSKMFGISNNELAIIYFKYLANYKTLSLIFFIVPYIALKIMGQ